MKNCVLSKSELLKRIAMCEFVCIDLNLYLDTHPDDCVALGDYNCYVHQLHELKKMYVESFGPLENFGNSPAHGSWRDWDFSGHMFQGKCGRISESKNECGCRKALCHKEV